MNFRHSIIIHPYKTIFGEEFLEKDNPVTILWKKWENTWITQIFPWAIDTKLKLIFN
jgi:hypothetical protein